MVLPKKYWRKKEKEKEIMISSKKNTTTATMDIPNDVIIEIFSRLRVHSLLRFRWVCKSWFNFITDPSFVSMQLNYNIHTSNNNPLVLIYNHNIIENNQIQFNSYNIIDTDDEHPLLCPNSLVWAKVPYVINTRDRIKILGSCNGLLCISVRSSSFVCERYFIWNPSTKEYKTVNHRRIGYNATYSGSRYGFGYDRTIDDYKLVKTVLIRGRKTCVYVYTLGTSSWKTIRLPYQCILCSTIEDYNTNGVFVNGHLYYTATKTISSRTFDIIVSFDIAKEEYGEIPIPVIHNDGLSRPIFLKLGELKGCLCLLSTLVGTRDIADDEVWMMRHNAANNIDVKEEYTWEKLCTISTTGIWDSLTTKLLRICKNGEILMVEESIFKKEIVLYDPNSDKISILHKLFKEENVENYMESLVSLKSGTYKLYNVA